MTKFMDKDPLVRDIEERTCIALVLVGPGKSNEQRLLLCIQQIPIGGANNVFLGPVLAEGWNVLDENGWHGQRTGETHVLKAGNECISKCCCFPLSCA
jgi:hypothetical protein